MSNLAKKRVHWYELNENTGEVIADEDVDVLTSADSVTFNDGDTLQRKYDDGELAKRSEVGNIKGLNTSNKSSLVDAVNEVVTKTTTNATNIGNLVTRVTNIEGVELTSTLSTGSTSLTFTDSRITTDSILVAVYTSIFGVAVKSAVFENESLTVTFKEQTEDMVVKVVIK